MKKFDPADPKWTAYVLNELTELQAHEIELELEQNPEAKAYLEELADSAELLVNSMDKESELELSDLQKATVVAKIPIEKRNSMHSAFWPLVASVAIVLVGAIVFPSIQRSSKETNEEKIRVPELYKRSNRPKLEPRKLENRMTVDELVNHNSKIAEERIELENAPAEFPMEAPPVAKAKPHSISSTPRKFSTSATSGFGTGVGGGYGIGMGGGMGGGNGRFSRSGPYDQRFEPQYTYVPQSDNEFPSVNPNAFKQVSDHPLSTFSIDVDTASYSVVRKFLKQGQLPPRDTVRVEELINYFPYDYAAPQDGEAFAAHLEMSDCPWAPEHALVRIALKGREIPLEERPALNLVYLLDVSGSMRQANKLPLVKRSLEALVNQLDERDRVAIVVYAGAAGLVLPTTEGRDSKAILEAIRNLSAGGSTAGGAGIELAYKTARAQFVEGGVNRVILCTDGDFNVGITQTGDMQQLIEKEAKSGVFLTALGFGMGNYKDSMLETLSNKGNGNYAYIDDFTEARKVLVDQMLGTMVTIAKDVKIQVEFNPAKVAGYRLIGYENRMLKKEDFNNDKVDSGDIGAGHTVTAFYEVVSVGQPVPGEVPPVDDLKYQSRPVTEPQASSEMLTLKVRHKQPDGEVSVKREYPLQWRGVDTDSLSEDFSFAASVAAFGLWLRDPAFAEDLSIDRILKMGQSGLGEDPNGYRQGFLELIRNAAVIPR
jgi:Ca-activated chloride channel family protein